MEAIKSANLPNNQIEYDFIDEEFISLREYFGDRILIEPVYYNQNISGASNDMKLRASAVLNLEKAVQALPEGFMFKILDTWRSVQTQQELFDNYCKSLSIKFSGFPKFIIADKAKKCIAEPSYDIEQPFVHNTGGAVDLTIIDSMTGENLDMGTAYNSFSLLSHTAYFEYAATENIDKIIENRRLLYWTMINSGFTNLPTEWWHYDFGTAFWSFYTGQPAMYKGVL